MAAPVEPGSPDTPLTLFATVSVATYDSEGVPQFEPVTLFFSPSPSDIIAETSVIVASAPAAVSIIPAPSSTIPAPHSTPTSTRSAVLSSSITATPSFITVTIETGIPPPPTPTPTTPASGLTPGKQAAIAVPIILAAIALLILGITLFGRRQKRRKRDDGEGGGGGRRMADTEPYYGQEKHELDDEARRLHEVELARDKLDKSGREMRASIAMADDT